MEISRIRYGKDYEKVLKKHLIELEYIRLSSEIARKG